MAVSLILCAVGLGLLTFAADQFVVGAARLALKLNISAVVVGAVIVGFGTSAPELLVSVGGALRDDIDLGVGNAVGSNVANLTLVLGVAALLTPVVVHATTLKREAPLALIAAVLFAIAVRIGLDPLVGAVLLVVLFLMLTAIIWSSAREDFAMAGEVDELLEDLDLIDLRFESLRTAGGLIATVLGSQLLVEGALDIADRAGLSSGFVGVTLVAIGTSLPELVTALAAARKGATDLIVGNLLGSNIFNSLAIGGVMGLVGGGEVEDGQLASTGLIVMVGVSALAVLFMRTDRSVRRGEAVVLLVTYAATIRLLA